MAEKLGNGGHGPEEYSQNDGEYVADGEPNKDGSLSPADKKVLQENAEETLYDEDLDTFLDSIEDESSEDDLDAFLDGIEEEEEPGDDFISQTLLYRIDECKKIYDIYKNSMNIEDYIDVEKVDSREKKINTLVNKYRLNKKKLNKLDDDKLDGVFKSLYLNAYKEYLRYTKNKAIQENDLQTAKSIFNEYESLDILQAQALIGELVPKGDVYSEVAKKTAVWVTGKYGSDELEKTRKLMDKYQKRHWGLLTPKEQQVLRAYTGSGFSWINMPLSHRKYDKGGHTYETSKTFGETVAALTNGINKCDFPFNMWVNRRTGDMPVFTIDGGKTKFSLKEFESQGELDSLVGTCFTPGNFFSSSGSKNTGYGDETVRLNIYCPKGTKMIYIDPQSINSGENEFILQRGYSYKITKVVHEGWQYYVDCEVLMNSIDDMSNEEDELGKLWDKYGYKNNYYY